MMRLGGFVICLLFCSLSVQGQPALRWAADPNSNAPYTFFTRGALNGFEYEIINAVARRLGRRAEFVQNDWNGLIPGLHRGLYDCVVCGIEIAPDKADEVSFSEPYYFTFEQFVGRRGAPALLSLEELRGRKIGTLDQTAALRMLEETPGVVAETYDQELNAYQDIVNGRLFGVLLDYPIAKYYAGLPSAGSLTALPLKKGTETSSAKSMSRSTNSRPAANCGPSFLVGDSGQRQWQRPSVSHQNLQRRTRNTNNSSRLETRRQTLGRNFKGTPLLDHFCGARHVLPSASL
jgi:ABC-type amino acid transport substrate-binding protein